MDYSLRFYTLIRKLSLSFCRAKAESRPVSESKCRCASRTREGTESSLEELTCFTDLLGELEARGKLMSGKQPGKM